MPVLRALAKAAAALGLTRPPPAPAPKPDPPALTSAGTVRVFTEEGLELVAVPMRVGPPARDTLYFAGSAPITASGLADRYEWRGPRGGRLAWGTVYTTRGLDPFRWDKREFLRDGRLDLDCILDCPPGLTTCMTPTEIVAVAFGGRRG